MSNMQFWIILVKGNGDKHFDVFQGTANGGVIVYRKKQYAGPELKMAVKLYGEGNARLQKIGPIS